MPNKPQAKIAYPNYPLSLHEGITLPPEHPYWSVMKLGCFFTVSGIAE